jgi:hypothetical protein
MTDFRALLGRYVNHVADREGVDFLSRTHRPPFTAVELAEIVAAANDDYERPKPVISAPQYLLDPFELPKDVVRAYGEAWAHAFAARRKFCSLPECYCDGEVHA